MKKERTILQLCPRSAADAALVPVSEASGPLLTYMADGLALVP